MAWQNQELIRDDDPYHAWSFEWRRTNLQETPKGYCPTIVELNEDRIAPADILESLEWIKAALFDASPLFLMADPDKLHLSRVIDRRKGDNPPEGIADYERIFLIYVREEELFPNVSKALGSEFARHLNVIYSGLPVGASGIPVNAEPFVPPGGPRTPKSCLAIIDDSFAYLNEALTNTEQDKSLFTEIWVQEAVDPQSAETISAGLRLTNEFINQQLSLLATHSEREIYEQETQIDQMAYRAIDRTSLNHQPLAFSVSHGTHVAATAVSSFLKNNCDVGDLALFGVALPVSVTQDTSGSTLGTYLLAALRQTMLWADEVAAVSAGAPDDAVLNDNVSAPPLVINFSYGFAAGPKDGSDALNRIIHRMINSRNEAQRKTVLVVPMGNSFHDRGAAEIELGVNQSRDIDWIIQPDDRTPSFLEIVSYDKDGSGAFDLTLSEPFGGNPDETISINGRHIGNSRVQIEDGQLIAMVSEWPPFIDEDGDTSSTYRRRAVIAIAPTASPEFRAAQHGRYRFRITNKSDAAISLHLTVQRDDAPGTYPKTGRQSYLDTEDSHGEMGTLDTADVQFPEGSTLTHLRTCSVFANNQSEHVFAIGAAMGETGAVEQTVLAGPSPYASAGPRSKGRVGPTASALSDRSRAFRGIYRAGTYSSAEQAVSGSSVAAPQIAGKLAASASLIDDYIASNTPIMSGNSAPAKPDLQETRFKKPGTDTDARCSRD